MFNLFGDSVFGQFGNALVNDKMQSSNLGGLAEYMNNQYGNGNAYDARGNMVPGKEGQPIGQPLGSKPMPSNPYMPIDSQPVEPHGILKDLIKMAASAI